jgi:hypothetical protein
MVSDKVFEYQVNNKLAFYIGGDFEEAAYEWLEEHMGLEDLDEETGYYILEDGRYVEVNPPRVELLPPWKFKWRNRRPRWTYAYHWKRHFRELHNKLRKSLRRKRRV